MIEIIQTRILVFKIIKGFLKTQVKKSDLKLCTKYVPLRRKYLFMTSRRFDNFDSIKFEYYSNKVMPRDQTEMFNYYPSNAIWTIKLMALAIRSRGLQGLIHRSKRAMNSRYSTDTLLVLFKRCYRIGQVSRWEDALQEMLQERAGFKMGGWLVPAQPRA